MKVSKRSKRSFSGFSVISVIFVLLAAFAAGVFVAAAEAAATDPLAGNYSVLLKDRLTVATFGTTFGGSTGSNYGTNYIMNADFTQDAFSAVGSSGGMLSEVIMSGPIAAVASVGGYIADGASTPSDFYGTILPPGRKAVVACAYLVNTSAAGVFDIGFTVQDSRFNGYLTNVPRLVTGVRVVTASSSCSYFSLVANDWNNDGYSDYILTYSTFSGTVGDSHSKGAYALTFVYVDGLTVYTGRAPIGKAYQFFPISSYGNASFSVSTAVGDVDGDGKKEFIVFKTDAIYFMDDPAVGPNALGVYDIVPGVGSNAYFNEVAEIYQRYIPIFGVASQGDILAVAVGDFDGDGKAEVAPIYSRSGNMYMSLLKNIKNTWTPSSLPASVLIYPRGTTTTSRFTAFAADLDGDGRDELIWDYLNPERPNDPNLHIHTWPAGIAGGSTSDPGNRYDFCVGNFAPVNRSLTAMNYSSSPLAAEKWLAYAYNNWGVTNTGLFEVVTSFKSNGAWRTDGNTGPRLYGHFQTTNNAVAIAATDLYDESLILGAPTEFTLTAEVKPRAIVQAPPKHWDVISGDGGSVTADAFSQLVAPSSSTNGYEVDFASSTADKTIKSTTDSSSFSLGGKASTTLTVGNKKIAQNELTVGVEVTEKTMEENTHSETKTTTVNVTTAAHDDDQLYYTETDYTLWRYPILWPASAQFTSEGYQQFVQFIVPTKVDSTAVSTPGRNVSWYQPLFDTYNLFTYPRDLSKVVGYPGAAAKPGGSSWADLNGKLLFSFGSNVVIGNGDLTTATVTQADNVTDTDKKSVDTTKSVTESDTFTAKSPFVQGKVSLAMKEDWASSSATVGTTDVSNTQSITLFWPGGATYKSPGGYTLADQTFSVSGGVYTQDDGTLRVSFAVPSLQNPRGSNLWGGSSPYMATPDPGLLLPWRYTWSGGALVPNTSPQAREIRGVNFSSYNYNALPTNTKETVTFRVFNYSFQNAAALTFDAYYQTMASGADLPDITKAAHITGGSVPAIPGRSDSAAAPNNWHDAGFQWKTPAAAGNGFMHIVLHPVGAQLSTANDLGYIEVGVYDASQFVSALSAADAGARAAGALDVRSALEAAGATLTIESLVVRDADGTVHHGALPLEDKPFELDVTLRLDGPEGTGLPVVKVNMYLDGLPTGSKHIPCLPSGHSRTIRMDYDPSSHAEATPMKSLGVRVFSEATGFSRDGDDPLSHAVERELVGRVDDEGSGSGGGCDAGLGAVLLAFGVFGALAARRKRG